MKSGHYSGSRGIYIIFQITDCPRFVIDQLVRHEVGVFKNVQSFRYVNKDTFTYSIPKDILDNPNLASEYHKHMADTMALYSNIEDYLKEKGKTKERANEQARYVLPMATNSAVCIGFTLEALEHYMGLRLCTRTEDAHRQLAIAMKEALCAILPEFEDILVPQCKKLLYCPESASCGAYPSKEEVQKIIQTKR